MERKGENGRKTKREHEKKEEKRFPWGLHFPVDKEDVPKRECASGYIPYMVRDLEEMRTDLLQLKSQFSLRHTAANTHEPLISHQSRRCGELL